MEDEPVLREMAMVILEREGFRVLAASDAIQANAFWEAESDSIDILLTDFQIPGNSGAELARFFKAEKPTLQVIIATGSVELPPDAISSLRFHYKILAKPFAPAKLVAIVNEGNSK